MKNNTFLILGLLLSSGLSFAAQDAVSGITGGSGSTDNTATGQGKVFNVSTGGIAVAIDTKIGVNACSGNATCLVNYDSTSTTTSSVGEGRGGNAIGDLGVGITISNAELLRNINPAMVKVPVIGRTYVYTFMQADNTYYLALKAVKLDKKSNLTAVKNASADQDTLISVFINRNGEKITGGLNNGQYKFIEIGELSLNGRATAEEIEKGLSAKNRAIQLNITEGRAQLVGSGVVFDFASVLAKS